MESDQGWHIRFQPWAEAHGIRSRMAYSFSTLGRSSWNPIKDGIFVFNPGQKLMESDQEWHIRFQPWADSHGIRSRMAYSFSTLGRFSWNPIKNGIFVFNLGK